MTEEFDKNTWKNRHYWSQDYDGISEPKDEKEELTRNAETVRDALLGKSEEEWNQGSHGWRKAKVSATRGNLYLKPLPCKGYRDYTSC